ncbi:MAG: VTC domain-containing protein, partial [Peptococcaceae bacterium]
MANIKTGNKIIVHRIDDNRSEGTRRIERKFFVPPEKIDYALAILKQTCLSDSENSDEWINSLYFDSYDLEQHEISSAGDSRKDKVRIRWYYKLDDYQYSVPVYIEHKTREGFAGTKQRKKIIVPLEKLETENLKKGIVPETMLMDVLARFGYFPPKRLKPVILISYYRHHFTDLMSGMRVSLDYNITSTVIDTSIGYGEKNLKLQGGVIEIKGKTLELPETLRRLKLLETDWTRFSKYSSCLDVQMSEPCSSSRLWPTGRNILS